MYSSILLPRWFPIGWVTNYDHLYIVLCLPFTWSCIGGSVGRFLLVQGSSALFSEACLTALLCLAYSFHVYIQELFYARRIPLQLSLELRLFFPAYMGLCALYIYTVRVCVYVCTYYVMIIYVCTHLYRRCVSS